MTHEVWLCDEVPSCRVLDEGRKLDEQVLVTEDGHEQLSSFPSSWFEGGIPAQIEGTETVWG